MSFALNFGKSGSRSALCWSCEHTSAGDGLSYEGGKAASAGRDSSQHLCDDFRSSAGEAFAARARVARACAHPLDQGLHRLCAHDPTEKGECLPQGYDMKVVSSLIL